MRFIGRVDAATQAGWYARARWYVSLPESDSVSVSVLEALAQGCIPLLSDLPANRELVHAGDDGQMPGWVARGGSLPSPADLQPLLASAKAVNPTSQKRVRTGARLRITLSQTSQPVARRSGTLNMAYCGRFQAAMTNGTPDVDSLCPQARCPGHFAR